MYTRVFNTIAFVKDAIIISLPEYIIKTLEDPELGIALVTGFQIVAAAYLKLNTVCMNYLIEVYLKLENVAYS